MDEADGKIIRMERLNGSARREYDDRVTANNDQVTVSLDENSYVNNSPASTTSTIMATNDEEGDATADRGTTTVPTNVTVPPDGGWGWVVVVASFCCNLVVDGIIYSFGMFSKAIGETFGESKAKVALIGSLLSGSYLVVGPFASALANRYGFRLVTIVGAVLAGVAFFVSSFATSIQFLYFTYGILGGIGFGLIFVPAVITIGFYFEKWRAFATGIAVCGSGIGTFIMAPLSVWLIATYTWQYALIIQSGFILQCAIFGALFRPLKSMEVEVPVNETTVLTSDTEDSTTKDKKLPLLLKTKVLRDLKGKYESSLSIYEDVGLIVDHTEHAKDSYFSGNANYPTASQILQLEAIPNQNGLPAEELSHEHNRCHRRHSRSSAIITVDEGNTTDEELNLKTMQVHRSKQNMVMSNRELRSNIVGSPRPTAAVRGRNKSVSPVLQKRHSLVPETNILLDRKYSLQPTTTNNTLKKGAKPSIIRRHTEMGNRPLYRDDIFFNSNLKRLSQYTSQTSSLNYTMSVTRLPTYNDILEEKKKKFTFFPEAVRRALATMLDLSLLNSVTFLLLATSGFFTALGMYTPFLYMTERAERMETEGAVWLMSVLGIANTIGRVGFGLISSIPRTNAVQINNLSLTICGICTAFSGLSPTPVYQFGCVCIFGATLACFSSLRTIIVVELLGLEKLTNAFGLLLLFQGVAAIIGPPLAGYIVDRTKDYEISFYASGAFIVLSAVICYPIEMICRWENNRKNKHIKSQN